MINKRKLLFCCCFFYFIIFIGLHYRFKSFVVNDPGEIETLQRFKGIPKEFDNLIPANFDCSGFYNETLNKYAASRFTIKEEPSLSMECKDIQRRVKGNRNFNKSKNHFAAARNVYKDYYLQEILLSFAYSPFNSYCYAIDSKSSQEFVDKMRKMSECLENVNVLEETFPFDSKGHFQHHGHFACKEKLLEKPDWKYVMLLQNADVFIKTVEEISTIIDSLDGAPLLALEKNYKNRIPKNVKNWTASAMNLFKNETGHSDSQLHSEITIRKSSNQAFVPRGFVEEAINQLNISVLLEVFNDNRTYGVDEMLLPTLVSAHFLGLPGQVENKCIVRDYLRFVHWHLGKESNCKSKKKRHGICLLSVEYLKKISQSSRIIANKIWPEFDFGAVVCIGEMLYDRWSLNEKNSFDAKFYFKIPQVKEMQNKRKRSFNATTFKC